MNENLIPIMTSNDTSFGKANCSSAWGGRQPYFVFDDDNDSMWTNNGNSAWISYTFNEAIKVDKINIINQSISNNDKSILYWNEAKLYGDGNLLTTIDTNNNETKKYIDKENVLFTKKFNNSKKYKEYKITFNTTRYTYIKKIELFNIINYKYLLKDKYNNLCTINDNNKNLIPTMTNDENDEIKLTCSAFYISQQGRGERKPFKALDRNLKEGGWEFQNQSPPQGGHWFKIQFKNKPKIINKINLRNCPIVCSIKNFKIQGSNDNINYEDLYIGLHPHGEKDATKGEYVFDNNKSYFYYKIVVIDSYYSNSTMYGGIGELEMMRIISPNLINLNTQIPTEDLFKNQGFDDITLLNLLPNKQDYKIFTYTDNMEANIVKLTYDCNEFRPIDKLKASGDSIKILKYIPKE